MRRDLTLATASSSARRAKPTAAAATEARKISSVIMAILKPCPASPSLLSALTRQFSNRKEIGRASCRERVCQSVYNLVVATSLKKKTQQPTSRKLKTRD